jgi:hypothetical protein
MKWLPIDEAPLGQTVLLWQRAWRAPFPGKRIGDMGRVVVDTCEMKAQGYETFCEMFAYIDAPTDGVERPTWAVKGQTIDGYALN